MDLYVTRPPKKVSEMTDDELRAWCEQVGDAMAKAIGWSAKPPNAEEQPNR